MLLQTADTPQRICSACEQTFDYHQQPSDFQNKTKLPPVPSRELPPVPKSVTAVTSVAGVVERKNSKNKKHKVKLHVVPKRSNQPPAPTADEESPIARVLPSMCGADSSSADEGMPFDEPFDDQLCPYISDAEMSSGDDDAEIKAATPRRSGTVINPGKASARQRRQLLTQQRKQAEEDEEDKESLTAVLENEESPISSPQQPRRSGLTMALEEDEEDCAGSSSSWCDLVPLEDEEGVSFAAELREMLDNNEISQQEYDTAVADLDVGAAGGNDLMSEAPAELPSQSATDVVSSFVIELQGMLASNEITEDEYNDAIAKLDGGAGTELVTPEIEIVSFEAPANDVVSSFVVELQGMLASNEITEDEYNDAITKLDGGAGTELVTPEIEIVSFEVPVATANNVVSSFFRSEQALEDY